MEKKTFDLLCNVGELTSIFQRSTNIQGLLHLVVKVIARHMETEACAIFLLDKSGTQLIMRAAVGFNPEIIGKLKLQIGEGITGTSLKELKPICVPKGSEDPNFKYVPGIFEEKYESFLAVPILHTSEKLGVIILEDSRPNYYSRRDIRALSTIASQLANFLENAKMLMELKKADNRGEKGEGKPEKEKEKSYYNGKVSSPGIAMGRTVTITDADEALFMQLNSNTYKEDLDSFEKAIERTKKQLEDLQAHMDEKLSEAGSLIFGSHLLMLSDTDFAGSMRKLIQDGHPAAEAVVEVVNDYVKLFLESENVYVQEKIHDVKDLGHRLLMNLSEESQEYGDYTGQIVIAKNLLPSELVKLSAQNVEGFVIYGSGVTSHVSILAGSLNVPSVLLTEEKLFIGDPGTFLILDGYQGAVILNPDDEVIDKYANLQEEMKTRDVTAEESEKPVVECFTLDRSPVELLSNINLLSDVRSAKKAGVGGVGLYRSEYLFLVRNDFVSEGEQQIIYRRLLSEMKPVYFRTMDIGGDKKISSSMDIEEENPVMGLRASRYALKHPAIFKTQLRALLQAGVGRELNILFPLIYGVEEFFEVKHFVKQVMEELKKEGLPYNGSPKYGAMIELPSAAATARILARHADFLSVGTNDLVQYLLGVDRTNESVEDIYNIYHPAVLRTLKSIAEAAQAEDCPLSVCGNSAGDETMLMFYLGIGIRNFSVDSKMLNIVRNFIGSVDTKKAEDKAQTMLRAETAEEVLH
ncbi:MAG: phosphoenolpyruvate--protein phosphotransferase [Spirochaetia bacterium]